MLVEKSNRTEFPYDVSYGDDDIYNSCHLTLDEAYVMEDKALSEGLKNVHILKNGKSWYGIQKCIECLCIDETSSDHTCPSCGGDDFHSSLVGQTARVSCLSDNEKLMLWCEENTYDINISSVDQNKGLIFAKDCPYPIVISELE